MFETGCAALPPHPPPFPRALSGWRGELGRSPWSDGMFKVQQLSFSGQRAAECLSAETETQNTELVRRDDNVLIKAYV